MITYLAHTIPCICNLYNNYVVAVVTSNILAINFFIFSLLLNFFDCIVFNKTRPVVGCYFIINMKETKKQTKLGLDIKKEENYSEWYSQVIFNLI